jgi:hypothetical protein
MTSIRDNLRYLLENTPPYSSLYEWHVVERGDEIAYKKDSEKALAQWIKSVASVLRLHGKDAELEIWLEVTSAGEDEEEHKLVLKQIIAKLDNEALPVPHEDMPENVKIDYEEARDVFPYSSRSAAALLRLAVQRLCKELGEKGKNLDTDIGNLVAKGLPPHIQQALDIVRVIGNEAVHPGVINVRDNPEIAMGLFGLVNEIVENQLGSSSKKKRIQEIYEKLPESQRNHIKNRDGNGT